MAFEPATWGFWQRTIFIVLDAWHPYQSLGDYLVIRLSEWDLASDPLMGTGMTTFVYARREASQPMTSESMPDNQVDFVDQ